MEENEVVEEGTQEVSTEAGGEEVTIKDPKAVLEALERAKTDAKKYRETLEEAHTQVAELTERINALEGDENVTKWKTKALTLAAKQQLASDGVKDTDRIFGLMDAETLDIDDEGNLVGYKEALQAVKTKLPELFDKKRQVAGGADGFAKGEIKPNMNTTEMQLARLRSNA